MTRPPDVPTPERIVIGAVGIILCAAAIWLWRDPPLRVTATPPNTPAAYNPTLRTSADAGAFAGAVLTIGALVVIFAANGRRLATIKFPGVEMTAEAAAAAQKVLAAKPAAFTAADTQTNVAAAAPHAAATFSASVAPPRVPSNRGARIEVQGQELQVFAPSDAPYQVVEAFLELLRLRSDPLAHSVEKGDASRFEFIAHAVKTPPESWFLKHKDDARVWRLTYPGEVPPNLTPV